MIYLFLNQIKRSNIEHFGMSPLGLNVGIFIVIF